jgi:hypothetical protein
MQTYIYIYICVCVCMYVCIVCIYIYIYICIKVMAAVRRLGERDPELWVSTLHFLANCETLHSEEISEVVASIEEGSLLPPLIVVQVYNEFVPYGVCGPYCVYGTLKRSWN